MTTDDSSQGPGAMLRVMILISNKMSVNAQCAQTNWWHTCSESAHNVLHDRYVHMHGIQSTLQNESRTVSKKIGSACCAMHMATKSDKIHGRARQVRAERSRAGQGRAGQGRAGQGRPGSRLSQGRIPSSKLSS